MVRKKIEYSSSKSKHTDEPKIYLYILGYFCCKLFLNFSFVRDKTNVFALD